MRFGRQEILGHLLMAIFFLSICHNIGFAQPKPFPDKNQTTDKKLAEIIDALSSQNLVHAKTLVQKVLFAQPRNVTAQTLAGIVAERENELSEAEKHFALAAKFAPQSPETRNNYGAILVRLNRTTEAAREFAASLKVNPNHRSALVNLANIRFAENNLAVARELFDKARSAAPDVEILRALLLISLQLGEKERAAEEFKEYFEFRKNLSVSLADTRLGETLLAKKMFAEARQELEFILANDAKNVDALVLLSRVYMQQKDFSAAGQILEDATARGISDGKVYDALSEVYQAGGFVEKAIPAMRLAIEKEPNNEAYRLHYGLLLIDTKAPTAAVIRIEEAIKDFPASPRLRLLLGMALFDLQKFNEAQTAFQRALELEPQFVPALAYLAVMHADQGRLKEAIGFYERAIKSDGKSAILRYLLADTILKLQEPDNRKVEDELKQVILLEPNLALAYSTLGRLYMRQKRFDEAVVNLERAVEIDSNLPDALYQLGLVYARLKRNGESKIVLAKFKELNESKIKQKEVDRLELVRRLANVRF
ncbi:MAG: tetratricopeptide repeat protein [Acidobacteriota bacterium]|nr:tetratricopeptide repeat protein [Acidobacteriota bacterium]